jgi:phosphatidate cytidylyltransferase
VSSELTRRAVFSVIAAPVAAGIVLAGGAALAGVLAIASALAAWEFFRIVRAGGLDPFDRIGIALAGLVPLVVHARYLHVYEPEQTLGALSLATLIVLALLALSIWRRGADGRPLSAVATTVLGVCYTGGLLSYGYALRYHEYAFGTVAIPGTTWTTSAGAFLLLLPVFLTWSTDIGAYAVGRAIGRHKLIPAVSPGKTVEGAIGGLLASVTVAAAYTRWVLHPLTGLSFALAPWGILAFGVGVSAAAQVGDLVESLLKREAKVKDSSHLIPGHGGVLDRFDSLLFVFPVSYVLVGWLLRWTPA